MKRLRRWRGRWVNPREHQIVKFLPSNPPERGDTVLVDGERCTVRRVEIDWQGNTWHLHRIKVRPDPLDES